MRRFSALALSALLLLGLTVPAQANAPSLGLTVLFTHDTHDHFYPDAGDIGGYTRLSTLLEEQRRTPADVGDGSAFSYPTVTLDAPEDPEVTYGLYGTNSQLDNAYLSFHRVKLMTARLAEVENSIYRLANAIKKTQSRANALKNIIIPGFEYSSKFITDALEEKDREEFSRQKVIKRQKIHREELAKAMESSRAQLQPPPAED